MWSGLYLDTNVYINWARGHKLRALRTVRRSGLRVYLSPIVAIELLEDFWFAREESVGVYRRALKLVRELGASAILPPPETFPWLFVGYRHRHGKNLEPNQIRRWLDFALQVSESQRQRGHDGHWKFDKDSFARQICAFRDSYGAMLMRVRDAVLASSGLPPGTRKLSVNDMKKLRPYLNSADWHRAYFKDVLPHLSASAGQDEIAARLRSLVDAGFTMDMHLLDLTLGTGYKADSPSNRGDIFDHGLLLHLAAPGLLMITADEKLRLRIAASSQAGRVCSVDTITVRQLRACAEA